MIYDFNTKIKDTLFAYTQVSHEAGFPLDDFPKIRAWIERVKAQPGFIPME